jgi:YEATS domain-containing protein 4
VHATGWGEFEITIKLYYDPTSNEKPQTIYTFLRLHPFGPEAEKASMIAKNEITSWNYDEQIFNEPYENFYDVLTSQGTGGGKGGGGKKRVMRGGMVALDRRDASVPIRQSPGQPYSREVERGEVERLKRAREHSERNREALLADLREKEAKLVKLREEAAEAAKADAS